MITEEQRRALFALREALHLCDEACLIVYGHESRVRVAGPDTGPQFGVKSLQPWIAPGDVDRLLAEHPE